MIDFSNFFGLNLSKHLLASFLFFIVAIFVAITSAILFFHWKKYSMGGKVMAFTEVLYIVVCVCLLSVAFFILI